MDNLNLLHLCVFSCEKKENILVIRFITVFTVPLLSATAPFLVSSLCTGCSYQAFNSVYCLLCTLVNFCLCTVYLQVSS